jgi:uncharacterized protein (DUF983 family)
MLVRGVRRRCPWCGGKGFFTGWFAKQESCASCGLRWRRGDVGFELGAAAITAIITFGPLMLVLGAMAAVMWPDIDVVPMFAVLVVLAIVLPFLTYGPSYTVWQAIDIVMRPPEPTDFEERAPEHR